MPERSKGDRKPRVPGLRGMIHSSHGLKGHHQALGWHKPFPWPCGKHEPWFLPLKSEEGARVCLPDYQGE